MKKRIIITGIIGLMLIFGIVLSGCDSNDSKGGLSSIKGNRPSGETESGAGAGNGTVIVYNWSIYTNIDAVIEICLYDYKNGWYIHEDDYVYIDSSIRWNNVPTGVSLGVDVYDGWDELYEGDTFTLSPGETRTYAFDGSKVYRVL